jgi:carboxylesterase
MEHDTACLLIHGLNGSPYDFDELAPHLRARGIATEQVLLPGHDVAVRHARRFGWRDWEGEVHSAFNRLARRHSKVIVVGHSMGGTLALNLAATEARVQGIVSLCAPIALHPALVPVVRFGEVVLPVLPIFREDIRDATERLSYQRRKVTPWVSLAPMRTMLEALPFVRSQLGAVQCPVLVVGARNDHVVPVRDAHIISQELGSVRKELCILQRSWHVVTRDVERHIVTARVEHFIESLLA